MVRGAKSFFRKCENEGWKGERERRITELKGKQMERGEESRERGGEQLEEKIEGEKR